MINRTRKFYIALLISLTVAVLVIVAICHASPFLVCDPQPTATYYLVSLDGGVWLNTPAPLHYDLAGIADGWHTIEARACNSAGCSNSAELRFEKRPPVKPSGPYIGG